MAGGHRLPRGAKANRSGKRGRRGGHRAETSRPEPYAWLGAGAVTLGLGAALATGPAVAYADEGADTGGSRVSESSPGTQSASGNTGPSANEPSPTTTSPSEDSPLGGDADPADNDLADDLTDDFANPDPKGSDRIDTDTDGDGTGAQVEEPAPPKKNGRFGQLRTTKAAVQERVSLESTVEQPVSTPATGAAAKAEADADSAAPEITPTQQTGTLQAASVTASNVGAAAEPAAASPIPKAIAVPVLKFIGGFLNLFGVKTNSPLPQLDVGLAAAWTWFRQLQTDWGVAPPVAGVPTATEPEPDTGVVTGNINATNQANLPMTYTVAIDPLLGEVTVEAKTGAYTYTPSEAARLAAIVAPISDIFTVTVSNGLASNYVLVTVKIGAATSAIPNAPETVSQSTNADSGLVTGQVGSPGWTGGPLTYTVLTPTVGGTLTFDEETGNYTYQPSALTMALASLGLAAPDFFTVVANNGSIPSLPAIITVPITAKDAIPSTPVAGAQTVDAATGLVTGSVSSSDGSGQALTYTVLTPTVGGTLNFDSATGQYTYQPSAASMALASLGLFPTDAFTVVATNGTFISAPTIITVPVTAKDAIPSAPASASQSVNTATGLVTGSVSSSDGSGQALTYTVLTPTVGGTLNFDSATGQYTYQPSAASMALASLGLFPTDAFTVVATNGTFISAPTIITVPVTAVDAKPSTPVAGPLTTNAGSGVVTGSVTSTDPAGQPLTYTVITSTLGGSLNFNSANGTFTYTPSAAARVAASAGVTTDVFTVVATNGTFTSGIASITVPIAPNPAPPSAPVKGSHTIDTSNGRVTSRVTSTDPNGLPLTYSLTTGAVRGTVVMNSNGTFTYTPTADARAASYAADLVGDPLSDIFTVTVTNGYSSNFAIITVPISPKAPSWPF